VEPGLAAQLFVSALFGSEIQYYQDPQAVALRESMHAATDQLCAWLGARRARKPRAPRPVAAKE
jgi:hypothetical protein